MQIIRIIRFFLLACFSIGSSSSIAQGIWSNTYKSSEQTLQASQDSFERQQQLHELQMLRLEAATREMQQRSELREQMERQELLERAARQQTYEAELAREAAEELRAELEEKSVRSSNNIVLLLAVLSSGIIITFLVRKKRGGHVFSADEKFGIVVALSSLLLILTTLFLSEGWIARFDILQNIMTTLKVRLFEERYDTYMFDIPSRFIILLWIVSGTYGFLVYLGIFPSVDFKKIGEKFL